MTKTVKRAKIAIDVRPWFSPKASKELRLLKPVFEKLAEVHKRYISFEPRSEISFWHRERSQVGLLATAVWECGFTALEEYSTPKKGKGEKGRGDLYIRTDTSTTFECEAKWCEVNLGSLSHASVEIHEHLNEAGKEARRLREPEHRHLALCFVTPRLKPKGDVLTERLDGLIAEFEVEERSCCDAVIWVKAEEPIRRREGKKGPWLLYPGLLLVIKDVTKHKVAHRT
jgi:hypothetical protein